MITIQAGNICLITKTHFPAIVTTQGPLYVSDDLVIYSPYRNDTSRLSTFTSGYVVEVSGIMDAIDAVNGDLLLAFHPHLPDAIIMVETFRAVFDKSSSSAVEVIAIPPLVRRR